MGSSGKAAVTKPLSHPLKYAEISRKFIALKKHIHNCNGRILQLKRRLNSVVKEVKSMKKERESHIRKVKKAERIERRLDAEKVKLKRKVLKACDSQESKDHKKVQFQPSTSAGTGSGSQQAGVSKNVDFAQC